MVSKHKVYETTKEIIESVLRVRYGVVEEPIFKSAYWFVSNKIPAYLRTEDAVWGVKENFDRIVRCTKRFVKWYDEGKIEAGYFWNGGVKALRCRIGKSWYDIETVHK